MADAVDADTLAAVRNLWLSDALGLGQLFPQPPATGALKATDPGADYARSGPRACLDSTQGPRPNERFATAAGVFCRNDYRKVTMACYGTRGQVENALSLILTLFNRALGAPGYRTLTMPSGARFVRWWPLNDGTIKQDESSKAGRDVWQGIIEGEIWTVRTEP